MRHMLIKIKLFNICKIICGIQPDIDHVDLAQILEAVHEAKSRLSGSLWLVATFDVMILVSILLL